MLVKNLSLLLGCLNGVVGFFGDQDLFLLRDDFERVLGWFKTLLNFNDEFVKVIVPEHVPVPWLLHVTHVVLVVALAHRAVVAFSAVFGNVLNNLAGREGSPGDYKQVVQWCATRRAPL